MGKISEIEWTDATFNPWWGCEKVSPACAFCYAESTAARFMAGLWGSGPGSKRRFFDDRHWNEPVNWNRLAGEGFFRECTECGKREFRKWDRSLPPGGLSSCTNSDCLALPETESVVVRPRIFCASMADVFEDREDLVEHRERLFRLIDATPNLDWLLLTKRPENIEAQLPRPAGTFPNVWLGTTAENQFYWDTRLPHLMKHAEAPVLFVSAEPLLGPIRMGISPAFPDWVIAGGESGRSPRPSHPTWFGDLREDCLRAEIPFLFKQWGEWAPAYHFPDKAKDPNANDCWVGYDGPVKDPTFSLNAFRMLKVGKKTAGRVFKGVTYTQFPVPRHGGVR